MKHFVVQTASGDWIGIECEDCFYRMPSGALGFANDVEDRLGWHIIAMFAPGSWFVYYELAELNGEWPPDVRAVYNEKGLWNLEGRG